MHLLLPIIVIGIEIAYYGQRLPILVLWLQKLLVSYCYWYWYCRFAEDGSEIDVGIAKDKSLLLVLILLLFSEAIKYWYWYWYCTPEAKSIDIDIELKFLLSHTPAPTLDNSAVFWRKVILVPKVILRYGGLKVFFFGPKKRPQGRLVGGHTWNPNMEDIYKAI